MHTGQRYLRQKQAAEYLSVSERTIRNLMKRRAIPFYRVSSGIVVFRIEDLETAMQKFRVRAVGESLDRKTGGRS